MDKPETTFRAGGVQASVFMNVRKVKGKEVSIPSVTFQKRYLAEGVWKSTNSLGVNDLAKAVLVLGKAFDYCLTRSTSQSSEDYEESADEPSQPVD